MVLEYYQVYSNDDPGLTLTYFTARSNLVPYAFVLEKGKTMDFLETIVVYDLKLATDDRSDKKFLLTSKLCSLPWGYIHVLNHEKKCIKPVFKEVSLKLAAKRLVGWLCWGLTSQSTIFSVMSGRSHRFLGNEPVLSGSKVSCSRTHHGGGRSRTPDLSLRSPTLYHWATALPRSK